VAAEIGNYAGKVINIVSVVILSFGIVKYRFVVI